MKTLCKIILKSYLLDRATTCNKEDKISKCGCTKSKVRGAVSFADGSNHWE